MKTLIPLSILCSAALSITAESTITPSPQSPTTAPGPITITIFPTQVVAGDATLTRNAPATSIDGTPISLGSTALVIGTSTIPFATSGVAPLYTVAGQTVTAGPAGVAVAGNTISVNGPAVTISGATLSLDSLGLVVNDASTFFGIPTVQPLQSVFTVGGQSITEKYGKIVFPNAKPVANISVAATGTAVGPVPTGSPQLFLGAAFRTSSSPEMVVVLLCSLVLAFL